MPTKKTKKKMTIANLDSKLAKMEAGKTESKIGDIRAHRKNLFKLIKTDARVRKLLYKYLASDKD